VSGPEFANYLREAVNFIKSPHFRKSIRDQYKLANLCADKEKQIDAPEFPANWLADSIMRAGRRVYPQLAEMGPERLRKVIGHVCPPDRLPTVDTEKLMRRILTAIGVSHKEIRNRLKAKEEMRERRRRAKVTREG
jgi:hypothetical protein